MAKGYIKLHRAIKDCWIWKDSEPFTRGQAWIDLLLSANHSEKKILFEGNLKTIQAGQFLTSLVSLSDKWKWDRKKVRKFLDVLETDNMITTDRTAHGTTITIVNWGKYQIEGPTDGTVDGQQMGQQWDNSRDTNKNDKECKKNDKKNNKATAKQFVSDGYLQSWIEAFIDHRKKLKKPMTDKAVELLVNKLNKLCPNNIDGQVQLIQTAIERGWQTVYPSKDTPQPTQSKVDEIRVYSIDEADENPPYYGLPKEWFDDNGILVRDRITKIKQPALKHRGMYEDVIYSEKEVFEKYLLRKQWFDEEGNQ